MVAVVCSPAEGKFRQVAGAKHNTAFGIGYIHYYLCPFACLTVFVCHIVHSRVMLYIGEMLGYGCGYRHFAYCDIQLPHESYSVVVSAVGGAESRHGHSDYTFAVKFQRVKSAHGDKQCEGRVQTA